MTVARVTSGLNLKAGDRFLVIYGTNTSDTFCTPQLLLQDIEQVIHQYLKSQNYQRILFYSGVKKLYFLDAESRDRTRIPSSPNPKSTPTENPEKPLQVTPGPLGKKRRLLGKKNEGRGEAFGQTISDAKPVINAPNASPSPENTVTHNSPVFKGGTGGYSRLQDTQILSYFEAVIQDTNQLSAIIFSNGEDLAHFDNRRELFGRLVEWSRLPPNNRNICILIFHHETRSKLQDFCQQIGLTFLANYAENRNQLVSQVGSQVFNIVRMPAPNATEIQALQDYFRLKYRKPVNWGDRAQLPIWIAAENRPLNYWYDRFSDCEEISLETAKKHHWLSADVSDRPALERLEAMVGLPGVKTAIQRRMRSLQIQQQRRQQGQISEPLRLHLIFKGNPGTGKTTVARLIGEIYRDLGLLQRGHVVEIGGRDLVAGYVGQTNIQTNEIIDRALDGVLFIDEAYALSQGGNQDFGQEAIDTLVKRMEDDRDRLAVIVAGYPQEMDEFLNSNPGLKRRLATEIIFEDYTPEELLEIFGQRVNRVQGSLSSELETALTNLFTQLYLDRDRSFGNAGLVENLFHQIDERRSVRVISENLDPLTEPFQQIDLPENYQQIASQGQKNQDSIEELLQELNQLTGLHSVKAIIREIVETELANQRLREAGLTVDDEPETRHLLFTGNPGTGKTTIARLVGRIFKALGILRKGQFVEVTRADLVAGYVGQTAQKTTEAIAKAIDGVLFIDEAYALSRCESGNDFGREAIDTLVPIMENQRDRLVVILAGYSREMAQFLQANSGLASRLAYQIKFPDYNSEELHQIFLGFCQNAQRICPPEVSQALQKIFIQMYQNRGHNFGNGRDVRNFYEKMVKRQKSRMLREHLTGEAMMTFALEDIP
jgi:SpoVK/Ycf46/Vps4 family AAA+-type ATPase